MTTKIFYRSGGNPPISAGLFVMRKEAEWARRMKRIAWWPAGIAPTEERVQNIALLCETRTVAMNTTEVLRELVDAGLVEESLI